MPDAGPVTCPNGHPSGDAEWCDVCGERIAGAADPAAAPPSAASAPADTAAGPLTCPHCHTVNAPDNLFCEECGYDFTTGQAPPTASVSDAPADPAPVPPGTAAWVVVVEVDPEWYVLKGSLADQPCPPPTTFTVALAAHTALIGRTSQSRGVRPEISIDADTGVSRRHAQLVRDGQTLSVVDLSSTNGTFVVAAGNRPDDHTPPVTPGVPVALRDGDMVYVGAWSRLTVRMA